MARYLFVTWDGSGNETVTLGLAQALRRHQHEVVFAGYSSQKERIERFGFRSLVLERASAAFKIPMPSEALPALVSGVWVAPAHLDDLRAVATHVAPDLVMIDCLLLAALATAERDHMKAAVLVHSTPGANVPPEGPFEQHVLLRPVNALRATMGLEPVASIWETWACFPTLCLSLPALDPLADRVPQTFTYAGPLQPEFAATGWQSPWPSDDRRPLVLVSFSSSGVWDQTTRIQRTLDGLADQPVRVLVTARDVQQSGLRLPENAVIVPFLPHAEILPHAAVVVTHGGHGTLTAALAQGVPVVCLPNMTSDQPVLAAQVAALGAGLTLEGETSPPEMIADAVMRLIEEPSFAQAAHRLADVIAATNPPATAVAWLEACVAH